MKLIEDFQIEDLGEKEQYVYDIEVEDNHNFFANDILVHNSIYITVEKLIPTILKKYSNIDTRGIIKKIYSFGNKKIYPAIKEVLEEISNRMNFYKNTLDMKNEIIADSGIWAAKKKYVARAWMEDGEDIDPKLKVTGIEIVRTSTPPAVRSKLKETVEIMLNGNKDKWLDNTREYKKIFDSLNIEQISFPRTANNIDKYIENEKNNKKSRKIQLIKSSSNETYRKGTPIHIRAAILYNKLLRKLKLNDNRKYYPIHSGDKIKFIYLKMPNPLNENIIAFSDIFPKEFGLNEYIDFDMQFEKAFLAPLKLLAKSCGWNVEEVKQKRKMKKFPFTK